MGTGRQSYTVIIRCHFTLGGCAQCPGDCVEMSLYGASWRLLDFPCRLIQNMANLLARCLIASFGAFPLDHLHILKQESVASLYGGHI